MRSFTLLMPTRNRGDRILKKLDSIPGDQMVSLNGELIVINSCSTDNTLDVLEKFKKESGFPVKVVIAEKPGSGRAFNEGIRAAESELFILNGDDCYFNDEYLDIAVTVCNKYDCDYVGGRILLYDENDIKYTVNYSNKFVLYEAGDIIPAGSIQSGNLVIRKKLFDITKGFNPDFGAGAKFSGDEFELLNRASQLNCRGAYAPELVNYHHHGRQTIFEFKKIKKRYDIGRGAVYASMISKGYVTYLKYWLFRFVKRATKGNTISEIKCFLHELIGFISFLNYKYFSNNKE